MNWGGRYFADDTITCHSA